MRHKAPILVMSNWPETLFIVLFIQKLKGEKDFMANLLGA